jgi:hypothetical protein
LKNRTLNPFVELFLAHLRSAMSPKGRHEKQFE